VTSISVSELRIYEKEGGKKGTEKLFRGGYFWAAVT
jgi:hypothetical protein